MITFSSPTPLRFLLASQKVASRRRPPTLRRLPSPSLSPTSSYFFLSRRHVDKDDLRPRSAGRVVLEIISQRADDLETPQGGPSIAVVVSLLLLNERADSFFWRAGGRKRWRGRRRRRRRRVGDLCRSSDFPCPADAQFLLAPHTPCSGERPRSRRVSGRRARQRWNRVPANGRPSVVVVVPVGWSSAVLRRLRGAEDRPKLLQRTRRDISILSTFLLLHRCRRRRARARAERPSPTGPDLLPSKDVPPQPEQKHQPEESGDDDQGQICASYRVEGRVRGRVGALEGWGAGWVGEGGGRKAAQA